MHFVRTVGIAWSVLVVALLPLSRAVAGPLEDEARRAGTPLVVRFGLDRCQQCIEQGRVFAEFAPQYEGKAAFRFVHIGREEDMAARYKVLLIPTVVIFDARGHEVFRHVGLVKAADLKAKIREVVAAPCPPAPDRPGVRDDGG